MLREVGLVDVRDEGRRRVYRLKGHPLKPIHDWVKEYERTWTEQSSASRAARRRSPRSAAASAAATPNDSHVTTIRRPMLMGEVIPQREQRP